jgi:hypothetical protein
LKVHQFIEIVFREYVIRQEQDSFHFPSVYRGQIKKNSGNVYSMLTAAFWLQKLTHAYTGKRHLRIQCYLTAKRESTIKVQERPKPGGNQH